MESDANPMRLVELMNNAPRCSAHSKRTGAQCKGPAMRGWTVCRMHGGGGGHKAGPTHPQWKHGLRSREWTEMRKQMNDLARIARSF
jgi:hypothetical protein